MDFAFLKVGLTLDPVTSMGGVTHEPDLALADLVLEQGDVLVLSGKDEQLEALRTT